MEKIICPVPNCGRELQEVYENTGWDGYDGPRHDECHYECPSHGRINLTKENEQS